MAYALIATFLLDIGSIPIEGTQTMDEKEFSATVSITYKEEFDVPAGNTEEATRKAEQWVLDDLANGDVPIEAFEVDSSVEELEL